MKFMNLEIKYFLRVGLLMKKKQKVFMLAPFCLIWMLGFTFIKPLAFAESLKLINQRPCSPPPGPIGSIVMSFDYKDRMDELKSSIKNGGNVNEIFCNNQSPLIFASRLPFAKYDPVVEILISNGANINHKDDMGYTALHFASYVGRLKTVKLLAENGGEINVQALDGVTPLNFTAYPEVIGYLLSKGADPNLADNKGNYPIHGLLRETQPIKMLLDRGAKINAQNNEGSTILHNVVKAISVKESIFINNAKFLIENGADPYLKDKSGKTPLDYIEDNQIKTELTQFINSLPK